ncbi:MAG: helix-turn-helix domain-containing protein, partial [Acidobacteriota bacterium]
RLNVVRIDIPPLRDRRDDIPALVECFLDRHGRDGGRAMPRFAPEALARLLDHGWPGNARELENVVERAVALTTGEVIGVEALPPALLGDRQAACADLELPPDGLDLDATLAEQERRLILAALERSGGVRTRAAELLGVTFRSLRYRLRKLGLDTGNDLD